MPRMTGVRGRAGIVIVTCCAAGPGITPRLSSVRPTGLPAASDTTTASGLPGRWINSCFFISLSLGGLGAEPICAGRSSGLISFDLQEGEAPCNR